MTEGQKKKVVDSVKEQLPNADESRIKAVLALIILEVETYNTCGKEIEWDKLLDVITEVLYQTLKVELDKSVSSVKRGDTTIAYTSNSAVIQANLASYKDLIKRVIGCGEVVFY